MYYAEIDENGRCFHVTNERLSLGDTIFEVEGIDVLGKIWNGCSWEEEQVEEPKEMIPQPTQLDRIESVLAILTADTVTEESIYTAMQEGVNEV